MARLVKGVAKQTNNFQEIDDQYAYAIWIVEKEFNVGPITQDYLAMKFWNLFDKTNVDKYDAMNNPKGKGSKETKTFGE